MKAVLKNLIFSVALSLVAFLSPASQSWAQPAPAHSPFLRSVITEPYPVLDEQVWDSTLRAWRPFDSLSPLEQALERARRLKSMDPVEGYERYLERAFWESYPTIGSAAGKKYYASYDEWKLAPENNPQMSPIEFGLARAILPSSHGGAPGNINDTVGAVAGFGPGLPPGVSQPRPPTRPRQNSTLPLHQGAVFQVADLLDASGRVLSDCSYWRRPSRISAPHSIGQSDRLALPSPPRLLALPRNRPKPDKLRGAFYRGSSFETPDSVFTQGLLARGIRLDIEAHVMQTDPTLSGFISFSKDHFIAKGFAKPQEKPLTFVYRVPKTRADNWVDVNCCLDHRKNPYYKSKEVLAPFIVAPRDIHSVEVYINGEYSHTLNNPSFIPD